MPRKWSCELRHVKPHGQGRPRACMRGSRAGVYKAKKDVSAETLIQVMLMEKQPPKFEGPVKLWLNFYMKRPKSVPEKKRKYPTVKPDLSNMIKTVEDAANGILYDDDKQIVEVDAAKLYGDEDKIELWIEEVG